MTINEFIVGGSKVKINFWIYVGSICIVAAACSTTNSGTNASDQLVDEKAPSGETTVRNNEELKPIPQEVTPEPKPTPQPRKGRGQKK